MGWLRSAAAGISAAVLCPALAVAQGNVCLELEARLVQLDRAGGAGNANGAREYDVSVAQQRNEIDRGTAEARRAGCVGGFLLFQRRAEAKCPQLMATIGQMRANVERLMRARGQAGGDPFTLARERNDLLRSLAMRGCGPQYAAAGFQQPGGGLFQSLFGQAGFGAPGSGFVDTRHVGAYRTLCVRTCDGYYFPISFSTLPGKFGADAATCQQMCPSAEAALYIHRNPGEDASAMVSLDGQPYAALPTAFRYRKEYDKACTCGAATASLAPAFTEFSTAPILATLSVPVAASPNVPMPHLRPDAPGEDPETAANRRGSLDSRAVPPPVTAEYASVGPDGRKIRIVGPVDFYAQ